MVYTTFILSLWSSLLSAAGMGGQLFERLQHKKIIQFASEDAVRAAASSNPYASVIIAVALFYLPIFISCFLTLRHIKISGRAEPLIFASLCLNTFSLLYGLILYGALAR